MPRNKYPEETGRKILEVSLKLFLEKGYDETTVLDIVANLGGLTRGAFYHHFKSKEEVLNALGDKMFFENNPFDAVRGRNDLNGLQKIREMLIINQSDEKRTNINIQSLPILQNPRILAAAIESNCRVLTPLWFELLEEGRRDGSIKSEYTKELSELLPLVDFWFMPSLYPATAEELRHKYNFVTQTLAMLGLPVLDEETGATAERLIEAAASTHKKG